MLCGERMKQRENASKREKRRLMMQNCYGSIMRPTTIILLTTKKIRPSYGSF